MWDVNMSAVRDESTSFFSWENGEWLRVTLHPEHNPEQEVYEAHPTDEGWSSTWTKWELVDGGVLRHWANDGADCDGRLTRTGTDFCPFDKLEADSGHDGTPLPLWQRVSSRQRDFTAEADGY